MKYVRMTNYIGFQHGEDEKLQEEKIDITKHTTEITPLIQGPVPKQWLPITNLTLEMHGFPMCSLYH